MPEDWLNRLIPKHPLWFVWAGFSIFSGWMVFGWSIGLFPTAAFGSGFARAEDSKLSLQLVLEGRLFELKQVQCTTDNDENLQYSTLEINRLMDLYELKIGRRYNEPPCSAVTLAASTD